MTIIQYLAALLAVGALLAYLVRPPPARARLAPPRPPRARAKKKPPWLPARAIRGAILRRGRPSPVRSQAQRVYKIAITLMVRFAPSAHPEAAPRPGLPRDLARGRGPPPVSPVGRTRARTGRAALRHDPARVR